MQVVAEEFAPRAVETEPAGTDAVGFGKNAEMTYDELWKNAPGYCQWAIKQFLEEVEKQKETDTPFQEGEGRMKRLAQWCMAREKMAEENGPAYEYNADMELVEVPGTRTLKERVLTEQGDKPVKFYGVAAPEKRVCTSWEECKPLVVGVKGVVYKSFATREEAEDFVANPPERKTKPKTEKVKSTEEKQAKRKKPEAETSGEGGEQEEKPKKKAKTAAKKKAEKVEDKEEKAEKVEGEEEKAEKKTKKATRTRKPKSAETTAAGSETGKSKEASPKKAKAKAKGKPKAGAMLKAKAKAKAKAKGKAKAKAKAAAKAEAKSAEAKTAAKKADKKIEENAKGVKKATVKSLEPKAELSEAVLAEAETFGMATALRNLAARPEVISLKLSGETLLATLRASDGLVNKAKSMLLDGSGPSTPPPKISQQATISPEKDEEMSSQYLQQVNELRAMLGEKEVNSTSESSNAEPAAAEVEKPDGLTPEQRQRVQENRERALAKKRLQEEQKSACVGGA